MTSSDNRGKDEYQAPKLVELGSLEDLTQGANPGGTDLGRDGGS
jgi:hypothetical protein